MIDVIIIGSGPAGLNAALYAKRAGLSVLVIEKSPVSGGQVLTTYDVDNYLGLPNMNGFDLGMKFREHVDKLGIEFLEGEVSNVADCGSYKEVIVEGKAYQSKTIIYAAGANHSHLGVPGEEELAGMGVSYCATCDGAFFRGMEVAVVGGGDVAVEDAIYLAAFCKKVYLIHRRDSLRAAQSLQDQLKEFENVEILWNHVVEKICGSDEVEKLLLKEVTTGEQKELPVQGIFIAVGIHPNTELMEGLVCTDESGYIIAGEDCVTSVEGIFAAGDARTKMLRQIITAVADGANAATSAWSYIQKTK